MKTRFLNKMAGLLAVLLLFSCTGKFEEYNTDNTGFTDEQKTYDYNTFGVWLKVVQMGIYFNYDWGSGKNWHFQTMQNLNADMFPVICMILNPSTQDWGIRSIICRMAGMVRCGIIRMDIS